MNKYQPVIGLEIHTELITKSGMFCGCSAAWYKKDPNSQVCPVCLGLPGALPQPNKKAIDWTLKIALALGCTINKESKFDRKHYFYPDLPKAFQTSQYDQPIGSNGMYEMIHPNFRGTKIRIRRVHLEEDTGKLIHEGEHTLIDFNRSGTPLVEIVTEPDFTDSDTVKAFLEELQVLVRMLGVADANMQEGSMRLEPNISLRVSGTTELPNYKVEIKNINSFRFAKNAIDYEIKRHTELLDKGENPKQETRGYSESKGKTIVQRSKEEAHDYRYFPEPDIPPLVFTDEQIDTIRKGIVEAPSSVYSKLIRSGLSDEDAYTLLKNEKKRNLISKLEKEKSIEKIQKENITKSIALLVINNKVDTNADWKSLVESAVEQLSPRKTDEGELEKAVKKVLDENQNAVEEYKKGKTNVIMFLVGAVMKEIRGQADAQVVKKELEKSIA